MPVHKLDLIFEAEGRGWEESYYRNFESASFADAFTVAQTLAMKRIAMCGSPVVIKAYRMQDPIGEGRQGSVFYFNPRLAAGAGPDQNGAASPDTAIDYTMVYSANNASSIRGLRGVWDAAVTQFNQLQGDFYALWLAKFNAFRDYLLEKGFGWLQSQRLFSNKPVSYSTAVDPLIPVFTFPAGVFTSDDVGTFRAVRFSKFNGSSSVLNGEMIVEVKTTTTAAAAKPIASGPMITPGRAIIYSTPVFRAANTIGVTRLGRRAPGAPKLYTPGRARARKRT